MANNTQLNILKAMAIRVVRLDATGEALVGASSLYVADTPILVGFTETRPDRERFQQTNGRGETCLDYNGPPRGATGVELRMDLCKLDAELEELLAGGTVITSAGNTIGYKAATDATVNEDGVALETWSIAWDTNERALIGGNPAYWRHVFPKTTWTRGDTSLENAGSTIPMVGVGEVNSGYDTGLATDPLPVAIGDSPWGYFLDDAIPAAAVGYQAVA